MLPEYKLKPQEQLVVPCSYGLVAALWSCCQLNPQFLGGKAFNVSSVPKAAVSEKCASVSSACWMWGHCRWVMWPPYSSSLLCSVFETCFGPEKVQHVCSFTQHSWRRGEPCLGFVEVFLVVNRTRPISSAVTPEGIRSQTSNTDGQPWPRGVSEFLKSFYDTADCMWWNTKDFPQFTLFPPQNK